MGFDFSSRMTQLDEILLYLGQRIAVRSQRQRTLDNALHCAPRNTARAVGATRADCFDGMPSFDTRPNGTRSQRKGQISKVNGGGAAEERLAWNVRSLTVTVRRFGVPEMKAL